MVTSTNLFLQSFITNGLKDDKKSHSLNASASTDPVPAREGGDEVEYGGNTNDGNSPSEGVSSPPEEEGPAFENQALLPWAQSMHGVASVRYSFPLTLLLSTASFACILLTFDSSS
jgi:hypothetical protein